MSGFFVTGTDTGVGKTHAAVRLMQTLHGAGLRVAGMKPVASGAVWQAGRWVNADALALMEASSIPLDYEQVNPYVFAPPVAPHLAAALAGTELRIEPLQRGLQALGERADCVIVEGVGGWRVPLNATQDVADLAVALGLPVLLVVGLRLGCINHARLTHASILASGAPFGGWIANPVEPELLQQEAVLECLCLALGQEPLGRLAFHAPDERSTTAWEDHWRLREILRLLTA